jgi:hypothetical protein
MDLGNYNKRYAIAFSKVLDIGVGYSHWSEHWQLDYGGEIHSLLATRPIAQQERYNLLQYRFLNGPVIDGDAFNDGTCNFYMLVKLKNKKLLLGESFNTNQSATQEYAILWIDEQTYFTQRWRLLHPTDDILGDLFSLQRTLKDNPDWFQFDRKKFWDPFGDGLIDDNSRMLVKRQIILLTGYNKKDRQHEIYSICFNYGVSDYSWRWRLYPPGTKVELLDNHHLSNPSHGLPKPKPEWVIDPNLNGLVYANAIELRDDTTIVVRGFIFNDNNDGNGRRPIEGRWFQKYLPADFSHIPHKMKLSEGGKPKESFAHEWQFISEDAYQRSDMFYGFGVFEEINSRCQYYEVKLLEDENGAMPDEKEVIKWIWRNDDGVDKHPLFFNTTNFNWLLEKDKDGYIALNSLIQDRRKNATLSMYEPTTRFKLLKRKPFGLLAVFYDKRDDELQPASHLPQEITLVKDAVYIPKDHDSDCESRTKYGTEQIDKKEFENEYDSEEQIQKSEQKTKIRVLVKSNTRLNYPPVVRKASLKKGTKNGQPCLTISFWTPQDESGVRNNVWKVHIAALETSGVVSIFKRETFVYYTQLGVPDPIDFKLVALHNRDYQYTYDWFYPRNEESKIDKYCTAVGRRDFSTSIWFEDVIGHKAIAQTLVFID